MSATTVPTPHPCALCGAGAPDEGAQECGTAGGDGMTATLRGLPPFFPFSALDLALASDVWAPRKALICLDNSATCSGVITSPQWGQRMATLERPDADEKDFLAVLGEAVEPLFLDHGEGNLTQKARESLNLVGGHFADFLGGLLGVLKIAVGHFDLLMVKVILAVRFVKGES